MNIFKNTNFILFVSSNFILIFLINVYLDYSIYQKDLISKYFKKNSNLLTKKEIVLNSIENLYPNIRAIITDKNLSEKLEKEGLISFGDIANSKIILCNEKGNFEYFYSDKYGFRNNQNNDYSKIKNIIIGDSFGLGICVNDDIYMKNIKNQFINLSVAGAGPLTQMSLINEYISKFNINNLVWFFYEGNDLLDLEVELNNPILKIYDELESSNWPYYGYFDNKKKIDKILLNYIENSLKEKNSKISEFEEIKNGKNFSFLRLIKFTALRNIFRNYRHNLNYEKAEILRKYFNNFNKIKKKLDEKKINLHIVFLPGYQTIKNSNSSNINNEIKKIFKTNYDKIKFYNFSEYLIEKFKSPDKIFINQRSHYNELVYLELYNYIENNVKIKN